MSDPAAVAALALPSLAGVGLVALAVVVARTGWAHAHNRIFALTILRIWIAYRIGAMRYGVFTFVKQ